MSARALRTVLPLLLSANTATAAVSVAMPGPWHARFKLQAIQALAALEASPDAPIRQLHAEVVATTMKIVIHPITKDRKTWHENGDRNRAHTEPMIGGKGEDKRRIGRPADSVVFLSPQGVDPSSSLWTGGALVHELVHAMDLANGRYHPDYSVRERRAIVLQNVWRARHSHELRSTYHKRFATLDYQNALRRRSLERLMFHIFHRSDLPAAPRR